MLIPSVPKLSQRQLETVSVSRRTRASFLEAMRDKNRTSLHASVLATRCLLHRFTTLSFIYISISLLLPSITRVDQHCFDFIHIVFHLLIVKWIILFKLTENMLKTQERRNGRITKNYRKYNDQYSTFRFTYVSKKKEFFVKMCWQLKVCFLIQVKCH